MIGMGIGGGVRLRAGIYVFYGYYVGFMGVNGGVYIHRVHTHTDTPPSYRNRRIT